MTVQQPVRYPSFPHAGAHAVPRDAARPGPTRPGSRSWACCWRASPSWWRGGAGVFAVIAVTAAFEPGSYGDDVMRRLDPQEGGARRAARAQPGHRLAHPGDLVHHAGAARHASALADLRGAEDALEVLRDCLGFAVVAVVAQIVVGVAAPVQRRRRSARSVTALTRTTVAQRRRHPADHAAAGHRARSTSSAATCCRRSARCSRSRWIAIVADRRRCSRSRTAPRTSRCSSTGFAFGLIAAGWSSVTGGLEAGIALHIAEQLLGLRAGAVLRRPQRDAERHRGELVEHRADRDAVRGVRRSGAPGGPPDGARRHHAARPPTEPDRRRSADLATA